MLQETIELDSILVTCCNRNKVTSMILRLLIILTIISSCQKREEVSTTTFSNDVRSKAELYKSLHRRWSHDKCDSMGFTALCKMAGGCQDANILEAEGEPGQWFRSPEKDCFDTGGSRSDISKDMFVMLFSYLYATKDKPALERILFYAEAHGYVMGRHEGTADGFARVFMVPGMVSLLKEMIGAVPSPQVPTSKEPVDFPVNDGFRAHLDAVWWFNKSQVRGNMEAIDYERLRIMVERQPSNALFQAIYHRYKDGDQSKAIEILSNEKWFPRDRLPTARDRCNEYLWQRDEGEDWAPCDSDSVHDGTDFLFAAWVAGLL